MTKEAKQLLDMSEGAMRGLQTKIKEVKYVGNCQKQKCFAYNALKHAVLSIKYKYGVKGKLCHYLKTGTKGKRDKWWKQSPRKQRKDQL